MISVSNAVVWVNNETREILVAPRETGDGHYWDDPERHGYKGHWGDPIGANYAPWKDMTDDQRVQLMLETAIDLAMDGFAMADVLRAFAQGARVPRPRSCQLPECAERSRAPSWENGLNSIP